MDIAKSKKSIDLSKEFKEKELVKNIEQKEELKIDNIIKNKVKNSNLSFFKIEECRKTSKICNSCHFKRISRIN